MKALNIKSTAKRLTALFAAGVLLLSVCGCAEEGPKYPQPTEKFFVNDYAEVLNGDDAQKIYSQGVSLQEQTTAQAVVVTVETLGGEEIEQYALSLGREWGVGDEEKDNGVVVLFAEQNREVYIAVGYGLEGALPDSKVGRIIDSYGIPYFSSDNFTAGLSSIYNSIVNEIYIEYGIAPEESYTPMAILPSVQAEEKSYGIKVLLSWVALIVFVVLYVLIFGRRGGLFIFGSPHFTGFSGGSNRFGGGGGGSFGGGGGSFGGGGAGRRF